MNKTNEADEIRVLGKYATDNQPAAQVNPSPEAKQAAVWYGWPEGDGHRAYCEGYDAATAKYEGVEKAMQEELDAIAKILGLEFYGYDEITAGVAKLREELKLAEGEATKLRDIWLADKDAHQQPSAPTPDAEQIAHDLTLYLDYWRGALSQEQFEKHILRALAQARAPLVAALEYLRRVLEDWLAEANDAIEHRSKRKHLSARDWHIRRETLCAVLALTGTGEKIK